MFDQGRHLRFSQEGISDDPFDDPFSNFHEKMKIMSIYPKKIPMTFFMHLHMCDLSQKGERVEYINTCRQDLLIIAQGRIVPKVGRTLPTPRQITP